jgi:N6-L-threonylcarbamoyladenine synthase
LKVLGIESSCDETGVALVELPPPGQAGMPRLLAEALHTQAAMHADYGGVVPELASRDHIRRVLPLTRQVLAEAGCGRSRRRPRGLHPRPRPGRRAAGGRWRGRGAGGGAGPPALGVHHLEGHLLSPFLAPASAGVPVCCAAGVGRPHAADAVDGVGRYALLGETIDDAAGEAFDKSAKLLGLGYPGGPALARLAEQGDERPSAAAAAAAQRRPRLLVRRPEDGRADAAPQAGRRPRAACGRPGQPRRPPSSTCWWPSR